MLFINYLTGIHKQSRVVYEVLDSYREGNRRLDNDDHTYNNSMLEKLFYWIAGE